MVSHGTLIDVKCILIIARFRVINVFCTNFQNIYVAYQHLKMLRYHIWNVFLFFFTLSCYDYFSVLIFSELQVAILLAHMWPQFGSGFIKISLSLKTILKRLD